MGADIVVHPQGIDSPDRRVPRRALEQAAVINGPTPLHGADVVVPDLRGGYSYVIAALAAEGESIVRNVGHHPPRLREVLHEARRARRRLRRHRIARVATSSPRLRASAREDPPERLLAARGDRRPAHRAARPSSRSRAARSCRARARTCSRRTTTPRSTRSSSPLAVWRLGRAPRFMAKESLFRFPCSAGCCAPPAWSRRALVVRGIRPADARRRPRRSSSTAAASSSTPRARSRATPTCGRCAARPARCGSRWPATSRSSRWRTGARRRSSRATASSSSGRCAAACASIVGDPVDLVRVRGKQAQPAALVDGHRPCSWTTSRSCSSRAARRAGSRQAVEPGRPRPEGDGSP